MSWTHYFCAAACAQRGCSARLRAVLGTPANGDLGSCGIAREESERALEDM